MENIEEDYEISNKLVSEYLYSLGFEEDLNQLREFKHNTNINTNETLQYCPKQDNVILYPAAYIFKSDFLIEFFQSNHKNLNNAIHESDQLVILKENLDFFTRLSDTNFLDSVYCHSKLFILIFLVILSIIVFSIKIFLTIISLFFILISLRYRLLSRFFIHWLDVSVNYLKLSRNIIIFIKQIDLVELAIKARNPFNQTRSDVNFKLRKFFFLTLRKNFYNLKKLNSSLLFNIKQDPENFVCSINENDLSQVMKIAAADLDKITDYYSVSCLNSIVKLNSLLISENFKLIVLNFFHLLKNGSNFVNFIFFTSKYILFMKNFVNDLKKMDKLCKSIDQEKIQEKFQIDKLGNEDNLIMYLRSCILNSQGLKNQTDDQAKVELVKIVRTGLECCSVYLDQIETNLGMTNTKSKVYETTTEKSEPKNDPEFEEVVHQLAQEQISEDEIFEAEDDLSNVKKGIDGKYDVEELSPREKQELMDTKNLFYELKFALKSKNNEWKEREKRAKHVNKKNTKDFYEFEKENHLLENDLMLYKSGLRKRMGQKILSMQTNKKINKYYYEEGDENNFSHMPSSIFNDLIATRNKMISACSENEEIFGN